ncbi:hypothetical protein V1286_007742 [Bradyrhizobium algeriense]|uniref:Uncharacterized protein n=1 Tax=Bradyrhizobium algeriense TaxID=634784 RepID=A0ABU8BQM1_9BRAD
MSTDLENITASFGLVRREFKDVHAVVSRLDTQVRRLAEPRARPRPPGGLVARLAACHLIAHKEKRRPADVCRQHFADDRDLANLIELKGAVTPAQTTCCDLGCRARRRRGCRHRHQSVAGIGRCWFSRESNSGHCRATMAFHHGQTPLSLW